MSLGNVNGFDISANGKKMIVARNGSYGIIDLPKGPVDLKPISLKGIEVRLDKHAEWNEIFNECWRQMRDFFYDPGMHGVDWRAVRKKYAALVPYVRHRYDLTYIIGEMIAELSCGHPYVGGGEARKRRASLWGFSAPSSRVIRERSSSRLTRFFTARTGRLLCVRR